MAKASKKFRSADYSAAEGQKRLMAESMGLPSDTYTAKPLVMKPGDYGSDPLGDGKHRMVPSGDIVDNAERSRRMDLYKAGTPYVSPTAQVPEQAAKRATEQVSPKLGANGGEVSDAELKARGVKGLDLTPEQARAEFNKSWANAYGDRPATAPGSTAKSEREAAESTPSTPSPKIGGETKSGFRLVGAKDHNPHGTPVRSYDFEINGKRQTLSSRPETPVEEGLKSVREDYRKALGEAFEAAVKRGDTLDLTGVHLKKFGGGQDLGKLKLRDSHTGGLNVDRTATKQLGGGKTFEKKAYSPDKLGFFGEQFKLDGKESAAIAKALGMPSWQEIHEQAKAHLAASAPTSGEHNVWSDSSRQAASESKALNHPSTSTPSEKLRSELSSISGRNDVTDAYKAQVIEGATKRAAQEEAWAAFDRALKNPDPKALEEFADKGAKPSEPKFEIPKGKPITPEMAAERDRLRAEGRGKEVLARARSEGFHTLKSGQDFEHAKAALEAEQKGIKAAGSKTARAFLEEKLRNPNAEYYPTAKEAADALKKNTESKKALAKAEKAFASEQKKLAAVQGDIFAEKPSKVSKPPKAEKLAVAPKPGVEMLREFEGHGTPYVAKTSEGKIRIGYKGQHYIDVDPAKSGNAHVEFLASRAKEWPSHDAVDAIEGAWKASAGHEKIVKENAPKVPTGGPKGFANESVLNSALTAQGKSEKGEGKLRAPKEAKAPKPLTPAQYVKAERTAGRFPSMIVKDYGGGKHYLHDNDWNLLGGKGYDSKEAAQKAITKILDNKANWPKAESASAPESPKFTTQPKPFSVEGLKPPEVKGDHHVWDEKARSAAKEVKLPRLNMKDLNDPRVMAHQRVEVGFRVATVNGERRLAKGSNYVTEHQYGKDALDYAEALQKKLEGEKAKVPTPEPVPEQAKLSAPKAEQSSALPESVKTGFKGRIAEIEAKAKDGKRLTKYEKDLLSSKQNLDLAKAHTAKHADLASAVKEAVGTMKPIEKPKPMLALPKPTHTPAEMATESKPKLTSPESKPALTPKPAKATKAQLAQAAKHHAEARKLVAKGQHEAAKAQFEKAANVLRSAPKAAPTPKAGRMDMNWKSVAELAEKSAPKATSATAPAKGEHHVWTAENRTAAKEAKAAKTEPLPKNRALVPAKSTALTSPESKPSLTHKAPEVIKLERKPSLPATTSATAKPNGGRLAKFAGKAASEVKGMGLIGAAYIGKDVAKGYAQGGARGAATEGAKSAAGMYAIGKVAGKAHQALAKVGQAAIRKGAEIAAKRAGSAIALKALGGAAERAIPYVGAAVMAKDVYDAYKTAGEYNKSAVASERMKNFTRGLGYRLLSKSKPGDVVQDIEQKRSAVIDNAIAGKKVREARGKAAPRPPHTPKVAALAPSRGETVMAKWASTSHPTPAPASASATAPTAQHGVHNSWGDKARQHARLARMARASAGVSTGR